MHLKRLIYYIYKERSITSRFRRNLTQNYYKLNQKIIKFKNKNNYRVSFKTNRKYIKVVKN